MKATFTARSSRLVTCKPAVGTGEANRVGPDPRALAKDVEQRCSRGTRHAPRAPCPPSRGRPRPARSPGGGSIRSPVIGHSSSATGFVPHQSRPLRETGLGPLGFRRFLDPLDPRRRRPDTAPRDHRPDRRSFAREQGLDRAVRRDCAPSRPGSGRRPHARSRRGTKPPAPYRKFAREPRDSRCQPRGDPRLDGWRLVRNYRDPS